VSLELAQAKLCQQTEQNIYQRGSNLDYPTANDGVQNVDPYTNHENNFGRKKRDAGYAVQNQV
jgi:hypothetical protein